MAWDEIPGQARVKRFLTRLVAEGRLPHALLFTGLSGTGKRAVAAELARTLNCASVEAGARGACGACAACRKFAAGTHPDYLRVLPDGAFVKVEQVRALRERVRFAPFEGAFRVIVIEEAKRLREEAANALLKTLEEPPGRNVFILLAPEPQMVLPTILSRCCHVRFQPLEEGEVAAWLERTLGADPEAAREAARLSDGSLERGRDLLAGGRMERRNEVVSRLSRVSGMGAAALFAMTSAWAREPEDLACDLEHLREHLRECVVSAISGGEAAVAFAELPTQALMALYDHVEEAARGLFVNANRQLTIEGVCLAAKEAIYGSGCRDTVSPGREGLPLRPGRA